MKRFSVLGLCLGLVGVLLQGISANAAGSWSATASMSTPRVGPTATLLPSGKVLVAGGFSGGSSLSSAELYDPATAMWSLTGNMLVPRTNATATLLPSGKVLVAGGSSGVVVGSAELYDPSTGTWSPTGPMSTNRQGHRAVLLNNGQVLVAGGGGGGIHASAELYNPSTGVWVPTGSMAIPRASFGMAMIASGQVLVAGGQTAEGCNPPSATTAAELYDPASGGWTSAGSMALARHDDTASLLPSGKVLIAGGVLSCGQDPAIAGSELYDPSTNSWTTGASMATGRYGHTATALQSGQVLVAGGYNLGYLASAELYDPAAGAWSSASSMAVQRQYAVAAPLNSGAVLVAGGQNASGQTASAELFQASDLILSVSASPSTATTGTTVSFSESVTNTASVSRSVQVTNTLTYAPPGGPTSTVGNSTTTFTLGAGGTASISSTFGVTDRTPRGTYTLTVVASDVTGAVHASTSVTVV